MSIVAFQGEMEFDGLMFDDQSGWRVRWRIVATPESVGKANPMKTFTKRRGDRTGTRFQAAMQPVGFGEPYQGEVMLNGWADSTKGWSVTFEFPEEPPFAGCLRRAADRPGTRYMVVLAEVDQDEGVVNQVQRERVEKATTEGKRLLTLSNRAALLVKNPQFHEWLREVVQAGDWNAESADAWLKQRLHIDSKTELDDRRNELAIIGYGTIYEQFYQWANPGREYG